MLHSKDENILETLRRLVGQPGRYLESAHAKKRMQERRITRSDIQRVLVNGFHDTKRDRFDAKYKVWNYSIYGWTDTDTKIRVIVSVQDMILVITVLELMES